MRSLDTPRAHLYLSLLSLLRMPGASIARRVHAAQAQRWGTPLADAAVARAARLHSADLHVLSLLICFLIIPFVLISLPLWALAPDLALLPFVLLSLHTRITLSGLTRLTPPGHEVCVAFEDGRIPRSLVSTIPAREIAHCYAISTHPTPLSLRVTREADALLTPLTPAAQETVRALLPEFQGSLAKLLHLAQTI